VADFRLVQITGPVDGLEVDLAGGPGIALIIDGAFQITGASESGDYHRGEALYATPSEGALRVTGDGTMVVATLGRS
jgi:mannose-6-phosphate isomerase